MQKLNLLGLSLVTIGLLAGCGSSSSGDGVATGTGFYVDSAVKGADYVCGAKSGITDDKGTFTFEKGQDCTFSVAGIPLRTTKADELVDGEEVFEDNAEVARFLQSIDFDGKPGNGIQITAETLTVLRTALAENSSEGKLPTDATLDAVVASVVNDVDGFTGSVKTPEEVTAHLNVGQTEITKKFWAGKTFYVAYNDNNVNTVEKHIINADATSSAWEQVFGQSNSGTTTISISGDIVTFNNADDDEPTRLRLLSVTDTYMEIKHIDDGEIEKLYFSLEDAKATFDSASSPTTTSSTLSNLIGKTVYAHVKEDGRESIIQMIFQTDGKINFTKDEHQELIPYRIDGNKLYTTEEGEEDLHTLLEITDKFVKFDEGNNETSTFYFSRADAEAAPVDDRNSESN